MKLVFSLGVVLSLLFTEVAAQKTDPIEVKKNFWGTKYFQYGKRLSPRDLVWAVKPNDEAYRLARGGRTLKIISDVLSPVGDLLLSYVAGSAANRSDIEWTNVAIGGGIVATSLTLNLIGSRKMKKAVGVYNNGSTIFNPQRTLSLGITPHGYGLKLQW